MTEKFSSSALTPSLFLVAAVCFVWSNNAHIYPPESYAVSFLVLVAVAAIMAVFGFALRFAWNRLKLDRYQAARLIAGVALGVTLLVLINSILRYPLRAVLPSQVGRHLVRGFVFLFAFSLLFFRLRSAVKFSNLFLLLSICLSVFTGISVFLGGGGGEIRQDDAVVILKKTPNIYLFWMESFNDPHVIDKYYGTSLVRDGFPRELEKRGFRLFEGVYSNSPATLPSMADLFSMRLDEKRDAGLLDVENHVRRLIGGSDENRVLKILKNNGYFTAFITQDNFYYHNGDVGIYLDSTDYVNHAGSLYSNLRPLWVPDQSRLSKWFNRILPDGAIYESREKGGYSGSLPERVRHALSLAKSADKPLFVSFRGGADHAPADGSYTWRQREEWLPQYRALVEAGISDAMEIVDMIVVDDPGAVIILMGDHGPRRLHGIWGDVGSGDLEALAALLRQNGESPESLADDVFNIILAIRFPGYEGDISHGFPMSTVNVFRHVFAALNNDPVSLEQREKNISAFEGMTFVVEGKAVGASGAR